jgi:3-dehydroquinate synthase
MNVLEVRLGELSYPIYIGSELLGDSAVLTPHVGTGGALIVTNETVAPLYLQRVKHSLKDIRHDVVILPDGEAHKTTTTLELIYDALIAGRFSRDVTIIALGGGVIGDMAGFAAATYQRGVRYIQIPTTLLALVDSSVGGKTAVNHRLGKNMIGAFHQPACVIADTSALQTLPDRELRCGIAETIKYGLIRDPEFFAWMETNLGGLLARDEDLLAQAINRACQNKAEVVAVDEREQGERALLNFGHTFGHAIETGLGHGEWLHGEAVAAGMCMAADLSVRLGRLRQDQIGRITRLISAAGLPLRAPRSIPPERMLELMALDKKVLAGQVRLILLDDIGSATITADFDADALRDTLSACREVA